MSGVERASRPFPGGHDITILTPGPRHGGGGGRQRRRGWAGADPGGGSHVHAATDAVAVQTHAPEVPMNAR